MKILNISEIRKQNNIWIAFKIQMDNKREKHQTILEFNEVDIQKRLKHE